MVWNHEISHLTAIVIPLQSEHSLHVKQPVYYKIILREQIRKETSNLSLQNYPNKKTVVWHWAHFLKTCANPNHRSINMLITTTWWWNFDVNKSKYSFLLKINWSYLTCFFQKSRCGGQFLKISVPKTVKISFVARSDGNTGCLFVWTLHTVLPVYTGLRK